MPDTAVATSDTRTALDNLIQSTEWQRGEATEFIARSESCIQEARERVKRYDEMLTELSRLRSLAR